MNYRTGKLDLLTVAKNRVSWAWRGLGPVYLSLPWMVFSVDAHVQGLNLGTEAVTAKREQPDITFFLRRSDLEMPSFRLPDIDNTEKIKNEISSFDFFNVSKEY
jgi:hypothetical protein